MSRPIIARLRSEPHDSDGITIANLQQRLLHKIGTVRNLAIWVIRIGAQPVCEGYGGPVLQRETALRMRKRGYPQQSCGGC